jgi:uncharacterized protein (DUF1810 family)
MSSRLEDFNMHGLTQDPYDLRRFLVAQNEVYPAVCAELASGRKMTHWMWFIFPQIRGLGASPASRHFAIASLEEARAYLEHPVLGLRLRECTQWVQGIQGRTAHQIFGSPDDLKFRSCLTLFTHASGHEPLFEAALRKYYGGEYDVRTVELLGSHPR